jgi:hypothetical protein
MFPPWPQVARAMHSPHVENRAEPSGAARKGQAAGFGRLARRLTTWTSNLVASAIVLVCALALGRHVLNWNRPVERPAGSENAPQPLAWLQGTTALTLELSGPAASLERRSLPGSAEQVEQHLLTWVRETVRTAGHAHGLPLGADSALRRLLDAQTVLEHSAGVRIYRLAGGPPLLVAVAVSADANTAEHGAAGAVPATAAPGSASAGVGNDAWRVLVWGMAVPRGEPIAPSAAGKAAASEGRQAADVAHANGPSQHRAWDVYTWRGSSAGGGTGEGHVAQRPSLPPGCRWTLVLAGGAAGEYGAMLGLRGSVAAADCRRFFDAALLQDGYRCELAWRNWGGVWHARFRRDGSAAHGLLEIQLADDPQGGVLGLVHLQGRKPTSASAQH